MTPSKQAFKNVAAYINEIRHEKVLRLRDKRSEVELEKAKAEADGALMWLGVLMKRVELLEAETQYKPEPLFETDDFVVKKPRKEKTVKAY